MKIGDMVLIWEPKAKRNKTAKNWEGPFNNLMHEEFKLDIEHSIFYIGSRIRAFILSQIAFNVIPVGNLLHQVVQLQGR